MAQAPAAPSAPNDEKFVADTVPFIGDRARSTLGSDYAPGADYKALALTATGVMGFVVRQPSEEAAKSAALEQCQKQADSIQPPRRCELYAVGNSVVYLHGRPPMPPMPWIRHDPATERPFAAAQTPIASEQARTRIDGLYTPGRKVKSLAIGPNGRFFFNVGQENADESVRRSLENCGATLAVGCMIIAVDDTFVVPVPTLMKATGFFYPANNEAIAADARDDVARQLAGATSGWNALAVGAARRPGLALKAASEQDAISNALANCAKRDSDCHVIAIGPFAVGPKN
jgi:adenylate cyclase